MLPACSARTVCFRLSSPIGLIQEKPGIKTRLFCIARAMGLEHYMFGTPCGLFFEKISQGLQVLIGAHTKKLGIKPSLFSCCASDGT